MFIVTSNYTPEEIFMPVGENQSKAQRDRAQTLCEAIRSRFKFKKFMVRKQERAVSSKVMEAMDLLDKEENAEPNSPIDRMIFPGPILEVHPSLKKRQRDPTPEKKELRLAHIVKRIKKDSE